MNFSQLTGNEGLFCDGDWIEKKDQDVNGNVRLIQLADIGEGTFKDKSSRYLTEATACRLNCTFLQQGDILIARLPDPLGRACIFPLNGKFITAVDIAIVRIKDCAYNPRYVMYMVNSPQFRKEISRYESGTTRKRISRKNLDKIQFNVPDLPTQEHIVSKIEELFSKLDASVAELQTAKEKLKVYRQAVLKKAFASAMQTGVVEISEIVDDIRIGPFGTALHKADYISGGIPVINPQHISGLSINANTKVTISREKATELSPYRLEENDIIMGRRGEMGRVAPVTNAEVGWICGTGSIIFRLKPEYDSFFYAQILSAPDIVHYLEDNATGTTMKNLNENIVKHIPVPKITREMQKDIFSNLEAQTSVCDSIEQTIDISLRQAEALRQSILKQAFEGELAT